jgi:hypothetical protein
MIWLINKLFVSMFKIQKSLCITTKTWTQIQISNTIISKSTTIQNIPWKQKILYFSWTFRTSTKIGNFFFHWLGPLRLDMSNKLSKFLEYSVPRIEKPPLGWFSYMHKQGGGGASWSNTNWSPAKYELLAKYNCRSNTNWSLDTTNWGVGAAPPLVHVWLFWWKLKNLKFFEKIAKFSYVLVAL